LWNGRSPFASKSPPMFNKVLIWFLIFSTIISPFSFAQDKPVSWEQKYAEESSLYLLLERAADMHKDWSMQFNQVHIK